MRVAFFFVLVLVLLSVAGCSSCTSQVPCTATRDCAGGEVCAATEDGTFCVPVGEEGEGEGDEGEGEGEEGEGEGEGEGEPSASLRLEGGVLEGDEELGVTLGWTLSAVSGCELQAGGVDTGIDVVGQSSATLVIDESQVLQIVCNQAESEELSFVVHDVSEIGGPAATTAGATVTLTFTVDGVTSCTVSTDGASASLTQPTIDGASGSFTDLADADKSYTLTCTGVDGSIVRTFDLDVLTVDDVVVPAIVTYGDSLVVTAAVDPAATCALVSTAPDGTDRRAESSATAVVDGEARTFTLANVTAARSYLVECSVGDATAASASAAVRIRPRIVSFDARIPNVETLDGTLATLEMLVSVQGREAGGSCVINDGGADLPYSGSNPVLSTGPSVATYTLRCSAPGGDATPGVSAGFQVLWRNVTEADLALLAASRFAMRDIDIDNLTVASINTGVLQQVGGRMTITAITAPSGSVSISAPSLTDVGGTLAFGDPFASSKIAALGSLSIPVLRSSSGLHLSADLLSDFSAPALEYMDEGISGLYVASCNNLVLVDVPVLESTRFLLVENSPALQTILAPQLAATTGDVTGVYLDNLPALAQIDLPALLSIGGNLVVSNVGVTRIDLGEVTQIGRYVSIENNPALDMIDAWQVTTIGLANGVDDFTLRNNAVMRMFFTASVHTMDIAGQFVVTGNPAMTCTYIVGTYCNLEVRDNTPTVSNNASASCAGIYSTC